MGAVEFYTESAGRNAREAFDEAVCAARYEHGHGGYTGTIAEKNEFVVVRVPKGLDPQEYARDIVEGVAPVTVDKWGPAGCIDLGDGLYLFFGLASS